MSKGIKWYRLTEILKYIAQYYIVIGERSNGKTYATLEYCIDQYFENGCQFGYVKRYDEDIKGKYMDDVFTHLETYILDNYGKRVKHYRGKFLLYDKDSEGKLKDCETFGHCFSLSNANRHKGTSFPSVDLVVFEEFMSMDCSYIPDEINQLLNLVSTIARNRTTVKVFMLANTISKYNPYFTALGLKAHRMEKGKIIYKKFTDKKGFSTSFAIERTENVNVFDNRDNKEKTVYNIFGNSGVGKMITSGDFETHAYPQEIDGYVFEENRPQGSKLINKKYATPFTLRFEDYYYRIYLIEDHVKKILAFREIDFTSIKTKNTTHVINGIHYIDGIVNINNIMNYNDPYYNEFLNDLVRIMKQKDFIVITDDDGENVVNGFRLSGMSYVHK